MGPCVTSISIAKYAVGILILVRPKEVFSCIFYVLSIAEFDLVVLFVLQIWLDLFKNY